MFGVTAEQCCHLLDEHVVTVCISSSGRRVYEVAGAGVHVYTLLPNTIACACRAFTHDGMLAHECRLDGCSRFRPIATGGRLEVTAARAHRHTVPSANTS
jgi:hypothetical protein